MHGRAFLVAGGGGRVVWSLGQASALVTFVLWGV